MDSDRSTDLDMMKSKSGVVFESEFQINNNFELGW